MNFNEWPVEDHILGTEEDTAPKLIVVRFDETQNWDESIQKKCKKIWGYYLVDLTKHIYQCSMTPDVQAYFLYNRLWDGECECECPFGEDELTELEMDNGGRDYTTFQASTKWGKCIAVDCSDFDEGGHEGTWEEFVEGQIDNIRSNPIEFEFYQSQLITL